MRRAEQILQDAMQLSEEKRGSLAVELLDSISAPDPRSDAEWMAEIERRAARALTDDAAQDRTLEEAVSRIGRDLDLSGVDLREQKKRVMERIAGRPWLRGVGIGLLQDGSVGVLVSVSEAGGPGARELLADLALEIPVEIRVMGLVQARTIQT